MRVVGVGSQSIKITSRGGVGLSLSCDLVVEEIEALGLGAVYIEPPDLIYKNLFCQVIASCTVFSSTSPSSSPVTYKVLLVEETAIGAEEGILDQRALQATSANVERLKKATYNSQKINFHGISVCGEPDTRPQDQHNSRPRLDRRRETRSLAPIWGR